jgi:transcriptional regulator with XRE-family HTH domain
MPDMAGTRMAAEVGKRLAMAREATGYSQSELARRLGVSPARLNNWETGDAMLPPSFIPTLFLLTRIDSNYLYQGDLSRLPSELAAKLTIKDNPRRRV